MANGDLRYLRGPVVIQQFDVAAGAAESIEAGEPVVKQNVTTSYVETLAVDVTSGDTFVGIACSNSTDTVAAAGTVFVWVPTAGTVYRGAAKTKASLAQTQKNTKVVLDYTSGVWTVDESTTSNGLALIVDYDSTTGEVDFMIDMTNFINA